MTKLYLCISQGSSGRLQQSSVGAPECVPVEAWRTDLAPRRFQMPVQEIQIAERIAMATLKY